MAGDEFDLAGAARSGQVRRRVKPRFGEPHEEEDPRYPGLFVAILVSLFGWVMVADFVHELTWMLTGLPDKYVWWLAHPAACIFFACFYYAQQPTRDAAKYFASHPIPWRAAILIPLCYVGLMIIKLSVVRGVYQTLALVDVFIEDLSGPGKSNLPQPLDLLVSVILAPLGEELLMRGLILQGLLQRYSKVTAILLSAALFGVFHGNAIQAIGAFFGGCIYGWAFVTTRSLWVPIIMHASHNLFVTVGKPIIRAIPPSSTTGFTFPVVPSEVSNWQLKLLVSYATIAVVTMIGIALTRPLYRAFLREFHKTDQASDPIPSLPLDDFKVRRASRTGDAA
jgi:membrane protease YdiL (CAAX protease family)